MKIINAVWEKRNLGCDAYEITLDNKDLKDFETTLKQIREQNFSNSYVVIKMPVGNLCALHALEDEGFRFMEVQQAIKKNLTNYTIPKQIQTRKDFLKRKEIKKDYQKWKKIVNLITPDMFTTDRIYLDPKLNTMTACNRYKNWIMDLINNKDAHLSVFYDKEKEIGFSIDILDINKKISHGVLCGVFPQFSATLYGTLLWDNLLRYLQMQGFKYMETAISSNNLAVLSIYMFFDFKITQQNYVLRKIYN